MSIEKFDDDCPGCRPAIIDIKTKKVLPDDHPVMAAMLRIWAETSAPPARSVSGEHELPKKEYPSEAEVVAEVKARLANLLPGIPVESVTYTVTFDDGTEKSWDILP
jgi:hypothetical protein